MAKGFTVSINVSGIPDATRRIRGAVEVVDKAVASALYVEGEKIMGESKAKYVPVKSGVLRGSGHVQPPKRTKRHGWVIDLGFGGPAKAYAVVQHEMPYEHRVGESKYLEKPALKAAPRIGKNVGKVVRKALRSIGKVGR
jgi:hypothetical protein